MALDTLGNTDIKVDLTKVSAKTPVKQIQRDDVTKYGFQVLVDGVWFPLYYDTESAADTAWATFS